MTYYSEKNNLRVNHEITKTYDISIEAYDMLFECCKKYFKNIAWKYPKSCDDNEEDIVDLDIYKLSNELKYEIPDLFQRDGKIDVPRKTKSVFEEDAKEESYNQYALLDFIEFLANNCKDVQKSEYHQYYRHYHLITLDTIKVFDNFQADINTTFQRCGLLYFLNKDKQIEKVIDNDVVDKSVISNVQSIKEKGLKDLLEEAIQLHKKPGPFSSRNATEKIWDAFERLKTYYTTMDKKHSVEKIIDDMANGDANYKSLFENEFDELTCIGNNYRIRHHETNKIDINDDRYYDYFFNRCLSLIAIAIQYLK